MTYKYIKIKIFNNISKMKKYYFKQIKIKPVLYSIYQNIQKNKLVNFFQAK